MKGSEAKIENIARLCQSELIHLERVMASGFEDVTEEQAYLEEDLASLRAEFVEALGLVTKILVTLAARVGPKGRRGRYAA